MKLAVAGVMLVAATALTGCSSQPANTAEKTAAPAAQAANSQLATAAYRCPMGCEGSASNKPGKCPVCEMELERNPDYKPSASTAAPDSL